MILSGTTTVSDPPVCQSRPGYTTDKSASDHHEHDQCTPFCSCACCAATITLVSRFHYSLIPSVELIPIDVTTFRYVSAPLADHLSAIWQPPQFRV